MKILLILIFMLPAIANAKLDCSPLDPRQQVGEKASISIDGSAKALFKAVTGGANYEEKTEKEIQNLYHNYPSADKLVLNGKLIYTFCTYLSSADDLDSNEKFFKLTEFMKIIISDPVKVIEEETSKKVEKPYHEKDGIVTELKECSLRAKKLKCSVKILSLERDVKISIFGHQGDSYRSRIILADGKSKTANKIIFDDRQSQSYVTGIMVTSIPMEATIIFEGIDHIEGNKIPLLEVKYNDFSAKLKSVSVRNK